jgi:serine/threonine protein kinase
MPPEVIRHEKYSFQADVYSFALVLWQLLTHEEPFEGRSQVEAAGLVALEHARPPMPPGTPTILKILIEEAWSDCPEARPTFQDMYSRLQKCADSVTAEEAAWLGSSYGHPVYATIKTDTPMMEMSNSQPRVDPSSKRKRRLSAVWNFFGRAKG